MLIIKFDSNWTSRLKKSYIWYYKKWLAFCYQDHAVYRCFLLLADVFFSFNFVNSLFFIHLRHKFSNENTKQELFSLNLICINKFCMFSSSQWAASSYATTTSRATHRQWSDSACCYCFALWGFQKNTEIKKINLN